MSIKLTALCEMRSGAPKEQKVVPANTVFEFSGTEKEADALVRKGSARVPTEAEVALYDLHNSRRKPRVTTPSKDKGSDKGGGVNKDDTNTDKSDGNLIG